MTHTDKMLAKATWPLDRSSLSTDTLLNHVCSRTVGVSRKICRDSEDRNAVRRLSESSSDRTVKLNDAYVQNSCEQFIARGRRRWKIAKLSAVLRQDVMRKYFAFATQAQKSLSMKDVNACRDETEWMHASGMKIPKPRPELRQKINNC